MGSFSTSQYAQTDEEEELALALALSASLAESGGSARTSQQPPSQPPPPRSQPSLRHPHPIPTPAHLPSPSARPLHPHHQPSPAHHQPPARPPHQPPVYPSNQPPTYPHHQPTPSALYPPIYPHHHPHVPGPQQPLPAPTPSAPKPSLGPLSLLPQLLAPSSGTCTGCLRPIHGTHIYALGRKYHLACLKCEGCGEPISRDGELEFATGKDDKVYHVACHKLAFHPSCNVCGNFIEQRPDGRIQYNETPFWRDKYCPKHHTDGTPKCCSCSRLQPHDSEYVQLQDGRHLCLLCIGSMVVDTQEAQPLYKEVLAFYQRLGMPHPEEVPLILVDTTALNDYSSREGRGRTDGPVFHVRGLCLSEMYIAIPSIVRLAGGGFPRVNSRGTSVQRARCDVTAILVIYGMPRLLTGAIIAHELMHAWLRMKGVVGLDLQVEEGLCQLMALLWLDCEREQLEKSKAADRETEVRLGACFGFQIREDPSQVYGDGFRMAFESYQNVGLKQTVESVLSTGRLPR